MQRPALQEPVQVAHASAPASVVCAASVPVSIAPSETIVLSIEASEPASGVDPESVWSDDSNVVSDPLASNCGEGEPPPLLPEKQAAPVAAARATASE